MKQILLLSFALILAAPVFAAPVEQIYCIKPGFSDAEWKKMAVDASEQKDQPDNALIDKISIQIAKCTLNNEWTEIDSENAMRHAMMDAMAADQASKLDSNSKKIADAHLAVHRAEYEAIPNFMETKTESVGMALVADGLPSTNEEMLMAALLYTSFSVMSGQFRNDFVAGKLRD